VAQCPAMRDKNAAGNRGKNPFANRPHPRGMAGKTPWNRGMTWAEMFGELRAEEMRQIGRANVARANELLRTSPDLEARRRKKLSTVARQRCLGQYREGSGRGKKGRYKGHWYDSSYELAFVIYALDHGFWFERNWRLSPIGGAAVHGAGFLTSGSRTTCTWRSRDTNRRRCRPSSRPFRMG
jgi:hypothetical protein